MGLSMQLVVGSAHLDDDDFLSAFRSCKLDLSAFRHGDHLRLAWLHLHRSPVNKALDQVREDISRYASYHGVSHIFHETLTTAWVRLLATHSESSFSEFLAQNEHKLNADLLYRYWTPAALESEAARRQWLPPDIQALPV